MAETKESTGKRNLYRALIAALFSSPIVVSLVAKYFDPIAVYKQYTAGPPAPPPAPMIVVDTQWKPFLGMMRTSIFQSPNRYSLAEMDFKIQNTGNLPSSDLHVQVNFSNDTTIQKVTGDFGMQYASKDGTVKPIEQAKDWPDDVHYVVILIPRLEAGLSESGVISFYYDTPPLGVDPGSTAKKPTVMIWDSTTKYSFNWPALTGK